jgi:uncharacterized protein YgiM (DUF1202 family)
MYSFKSGTKTPGKVIHKSKVRTEVKFMSKDIRKWPKLKLKTAKAVSTKTAKNPRFKVSSPKLKLK